MNATRCWQQLILIIMTPREFLKTKFPEYEKERGLTGHDDLHQEKMMKEYADYCVQQIVLKSNSFQKEHYGKVFDTANELYLKEFKAWWESHF